MPIGTFRRRSAIWASVLLRTVLTRAPPAPSATRRVSGLAIARLRRTRGVRLTVAITSTTLVRTTSVALMFLNARGVIEQIGHRTKTLCQKTEEAILIHFTIVVPGAIPDAEGSGNGDRSSELIYHSSFSLGKNKVFGSHLSCIERRIFPKLFFS